MMRVGTLVALFVGGTIAVAHTWTGATIGAEPATPAKTNGAEAIRPFRVHYPDEALADLKRRIAATRWPEREIVTDQSQGVQLATMQKLARYWASEYDWRKCEARLNALPQFITDHRWRRHPLHPRAFEAPNALPMVVTHGWPGSVIEQLKIIDPLTNPTAQAGARRTLSTS